MTGKRNRHSVVKQGGIARDPSDAEDVSRDTYGDPRPAPRRKRREERVSQASRAAAAAGIPGVAMPEAEAARHDAGKIKARRS